MLLYMLRHGEALDDIEDCYGGIADFPLTDRGREQARAVGKELAKKGIEEIYTSPLARAEESARIIAAEAGDSVLVTVVEDLQERNSYGVLSGVNKERAKEIFGRVLLQLTEKPGYSREPLVGAEDFDVFIQRVRRAFDEVLRLAQSKKQQRIAIMTHGKFTQALFEEVLRLEGKIDLKLSAMNVIDYRLATAVLVVG
jgi:broad specificity phosphatase PhoE